MSEPTLTVLFTERIGALERIVSLLRRRGFPICGMTVERTHQPNVGRMSITVEQPAAVPQVHRHLLRLADVRGVRVEDRHAVRREYALVRVRCSEGQQEAVAAAASAFGGRTVSAGANHLVIEATGHQSQIDGLFHALAAYAIDESARTSPIALSHEPDERVPDLEDSRWGYTGSH